MTDDGVYLYNGGDSDLFQISHGSGSLNWTYMGLWDVTSKATDSDGLLSFMNNFDEVFYEKLVQDRRLTALDIYMRLVDIRGFSYSNHLWLLQTMKIYLFGGIRTIIYPRFDDSDGTGGRMMQFHRRYDGVRVIGDMCINL